MSMIKPVVTAIAVCLTLALILYYTKSKRERDKESEQDIFLRAVLPGLVVGGLVAVMMMNAGSREMRLPWFMRRFFVPKKVYLDEEYFD